MNAQEWLEEGGHLDNDNGLFPTSFLMERYNNYRTKELQAKILEFRKKIKCEWLEMPYRYNEDFLKEFDKNFGIEQLNTGKI